jgi:hypothetical protein
MADIDSVRTAIFNADNVAETMVQWMDEWITKCVLPQHPGQEEATRRMIRKDLFDRLAAQLGLTAENLREMADEMDEAQGDTG